MESDAPGIVLCRAEGAVNVGASCRAMKAMGITRLELAACPEYDETIVKTYALSAFDVYASAKRHDSLEAALSGFSYAAGFTRRRGQRRKEPMLVGELAARLVSGCPGSAALVFGNERDGLSDAELAACDDAVAIPSSELFPSLNLSHAVQIACWEYRSKLLMGTADAADRAIGGGADGDSGDEDFDGARMPDRSPAGRFPAGRSALWTEIGRIADTLESAGFFKLVGRGDMETFLRGVAARAGLSEAELQRFSGVFVKLAAMRGGPSP